ncbi:MAG: Anti-anti-sigma regulatory factor (antagonist of anti-sigma factor) [Chloroflexi bacterium AL-W]|nr:Anti-anti-sigma regulatory factor (antagonist of anti-sigma factor) [Chloroflexi bacterium AL-N1]NOK71011.1 Anti-anti-sigma regulatory factor (antagonist of anti-sigma factor) [Chloroflexi bacterium AL-N10]NOK72766.1 Anti-anti-sigma regulatory factor (antagonist of anti-sigma factor) [Chloroflexi bacterium AL-N5]NOK79147.1 Anti-anti-sigma regulatory factor (antagonist of anti-sigma factor) [Chloroflexi bacterium AL-W]NOK87061.1 Anti-anti-sigma regulatory factor (antagonist of anti-sigma fact
MPNLTDEDRALIQIIGSNLRHIIQGHRIQAQEFDRRDELGILANMVNRVAKELHNSRQRDQRQREEIERQLGELRSAHETQERLLSTIRDLSTPILNIHQGVLLLPIIGFLDTSRAEHVITTLLGRITTIQAHVIILDVTGVHTLDTQVANVLLQAARAVELLGARVILCGISPEVAQVVVSLGIDLSTLTPSSNLQEALATALRLTKKHGMSTKTEEPQTR